MEQPDPAERDERLWVRPSQEYMDRRRQSNPGHFFVICCFLNPSQTSQILDEPASQRKFFNGFNSFGFISGGVQLVTFCGILVAIHLRPPKPLTHWHQRWCRKKGIGLMLTAVNISDTQTSAVKRWFTGGGTYALTVDRDKYRDIIKRNL
jgi:hypothetical protein